MYLFLILFSSAGTSGNVRYDSVPEGRYVLKLTARASNGERDIVRRKIVVGKLTKSQLNNKNLEFYNLPRLILKARHIRLFS